MNAAPMRLERGGALAIEAWDRTPVHLLADLLSNPALMAPPRAIIPRLAYEGRITLLSAPRKSGKSTLIGAAAAALSSGQPFLGQPTDPGVVVWACLDEPLGDLARRLHAGRADPLEVLVVGAPCSTSELIRIAESDDMRPTSLLVVDSLGDLFAREVESENDSPQVRRAMEPLRAFARRSGTAVLLNHHTNKATGRARGAGAFEEVADIVLTLSRSTDDPTVRKVNAEGRAGVEDFSFRLCADGIELADTTPTPMVRVEAAIWANPGCSTREVERKVGGRAEVVRGAIAILHLLGRIEDTGTARNHRWVLRESGRAQDALVSADAHPSGDATGRTPDAAPEAGCASPPFGGTHPRGRTSRGPDGKPSAQEGRL